MADQLTGDAIPQFVAWFRSVAPFLHAFRGKTFVVAFGGEVAGSQHFFEFAHDLNLLHSAGIRIVLVHGSRRQIEAKLKTQKIRSRFAEKLRITDAAALDGGSYNILMHNIAGTLTYDIVNAGSGAIVSSGNAFSSGASISVAGMTVKITGVPADGDTYQLAPATTRTIFQSLDDLVQALRAPVSDDVTRAQLSAHIASGLAQLDQAAETTQLARAGAGAALKEIDTLQAVAGVQDEQLQFQIAGIRDLDYTKAATDLSQRQLVLDAAQKAYSRTLGHSLFDYL